MAVRCPSCGASNRAKARYCQSCAGPLTAARSDHVETTDAAPEIRGERRHLTALFCDLVDSTALAARLDPEEWSHIAAQYQRAASDAVVRFGGHVAKFLGDGLVVYFGYPRAHEDDAQRASRAGLEILSQIATLNEALVAKGQPRLGVRVGIHTGSVVIGAGGGNEPEVFGDTPNIASRVQAAAEPDTVLVTSAVNRLIAGNFIVEPRGPHQLKGIEAPIDLFQVVRPSDRRGRIAAASAARSLTPFVSRQDEMRLLAHRWDLARGGEGQVVCIAGEPGIGKSRVIQQFREMIAGTPHTWIECASAAYFQNTPFYSIIDLLQDQLDFRSSDSPATRLERLEHVLDSAGLKVTEAVPLVAQLLNLPVPDKYPPLLLAPEQKRTRLLTILSTWILGGPDPQPAVIVVEDLHWTDPSTIELLQVVVEQAATLPLMLLLTARPEFRVPWPMRAHHAQINLNRLSNAQTRQLVTGVASHAILAPGVLEAVVDRTGGIPLFAEELIRTILENNGATSSREIPATLHDSLMARLDRLGRAKEIAQIAAVIGRDFSYEILRAVSAASEDELRMALLRLADAELIYPRGVPPDATYVFKHALMQEAAYEALLKSHRRELHREIAAVITERLPTVAKTQPEILARHWSAAGETQHAIAAWQGAADAAFARRAFKEAEQALREALAILATMPDTPERHSRELRLQRRLVPVLQVTRGYSAPETIEARNHSLSLAEKSGNLVQLVGQGLAAWAGTINLGDLATAGELAAQLNVHAEREGGAESVGYACHANLITAFYRGDLAVAEEQYARGRASFELPAFGRFPGTVASTLGHSGWNACLMGRVGEARARFDRAIAHARESSNPYNLAFALDMASGFHLLLREYDQAEAISREVIPVCETHGFQYFAATSTIKLGRARASANPAEGVAMIRKGVGALAALANQLCITMYLTWLAEALDFEGNADSALATLEQAVQTSPLELYYRPETLRLRGAMRLRNSGPDLAEADFRQAIALAQKIGAGLWELRASVDLARMLAARGASMEARDLIKSVCTGVTGDAKIPDLEDAQTLLDELSRQLR